MCSNRRQWRFTWEILAHIPTLRLYLFHPEIDPSAQCFDLHASLRFEESLLLVSFVHGEAEVRLRVPVPRVLIDPSCLIGCCAKVDHIEMKLALVLPVDHPLVAEFCAAHGSEQLLPLSLGDDIKNLSSGGVHFYCKTCSTKLTKQPLRHIVEMPSVDWQEVADNWFGNCCCSFGGISEKLVSRYINNYNCSQGTCLLDVASVIVCKDDLEGYTFHETSDEYVQQQTVDNVGLFKEGNYRSLHEDIPDLSTTQPYAAGKVESMNLSPQIETFVHQMDSTLSFPLLSSTDCFSNFVEENKVNGNLAQSNLAETRDVTAADFLKLNLDSCPENMERTFQQSADELSSVNPCHCCNHTKISEKAVHDFSVTPMENQKIIDSMLSQRSCKWPYNTYLGGGFLFKSSNLSSDVEWVEFLCKNCSSPLGSYPSKSTKGPVDGGVRLFKCYISTCAPVGGLHDVLRKHSLQKIFVNLLVECAEDEISFRTIVKDLKSKTSMLQLVLLSLKAWCSTGYCFENDSIGPHCTPDLRPVAKVLFSDCSTASEADSRALKDWSTKHHAEEVYMMRHQIEELTKYLKSAKNGLPFSCSSLQGMHMSSLDR
ncbi:uncharacterized protein [Typha angustifolia]|uniref:uncharacterized protein isoform X2 n=1 Tax=Typha angustifolia TaxID=59011 RepID=UPI003C2CFFCA